MTVLTVVQGQKVDEILEKAMKYSWSIHETQSIIKQFENLTVDFRTITRRANRVFNYEFFEGASELTDLEILKVELLTHLGTDSRGENYHNNFILSIITRTNY